MHLSKTLGISQDIGLSFIAIIQDIDNNNIKFYLFDIM